MYILSDSARAISKVGAASAATSGATFIVLSDESSLGKGEAHVEYQCLVCSCILCVIFGGARRGC